MENLIHYVFARDYQMTRELAATKDGKITGLRVHVLADHGAFDACADPSKFPAGFMNICTGSYDIPTAYLAVDGVYTNKARAASPIAARSASPKRPVCDRADGRGAGRSSSAWTRPSCASRTSSRSSSRTSRRSAGSMTAATITPPWDKALEGRRLQGLRKEQAKRIEAFKRGETREIMGIGI
jgi:carbon-monoxide dehydrogenase large subunit